MTDESKIIYVSAIGLDEAGDGTKQKPFRTITKATKTAKYGDTIRVSEGLYEEEKSIELPLGINLIGAGPDRTVLKADKISKGYLIVLKSVKNMDGNQELSGFTIEGNKSLWGGVLVENVNNVTLCYAEFKNCVGNGAMVIADFYRELNNGVWPTEFINGIKLHDLNFINCATYYCNHEELKGLSSTDMMIEGSCMGDGASIKGMNGNLMLGAIDGAEIYNVKIKDTYERGGYGIKFWGRGFFKNLIIHDCDIEVNTKAPAWESDFCIELWNVGEGCEIYNVKANTVFSLTMSKPAEVGNYSKNLKVHHCTIINTRDGGSNNEAIEADVSNMEFYDNYVENASIGAAYWYKTEYTSIHNNVFKINKQMSDYWGGIRPVGVLLDIGANGPCDPVNGNMEIFDNVFDGYDVGIGFYNRTQNQDERLRAFNIEVYDNEFRNMKEAICKVTDNVTEGNLAGIRFFENKKDTEIPWIINGSKAKDIEIKVEH